MNLEMFSVFLVTLLFTIISIYYTRANIKLNKLFNDKAWFINICVIIVFSAYIMHKEPSSDLKDKDSKDIEHQQDAIKKAVMSFIIGLFGSLDLTIGPFWVVFVVAYYLNGFI